MRIPYLIILTAIFLISCGQDAQQSENLNANDMMVRISEIEIEPEFLEEYLAILNEESRASVALEPGVISIYPMFQKENPTEIRILEIYLNRKAYEAHLETSHFKHYTTTLNMVKSLKLVDMSSIDGASMPMIFKKIN